jgi:hypothetical protein
MEKSEEKVKKSNSVILENNQNVEAGKGYLDTFKDVFNETSRGIVEVLANTFNRSKSVLDRQQLEEEKEEIHKEKYYKLPDNVMEEFEKDCKIMDHEHKKEQK